MGRKLYVGNFPYETGEAELQELFARSGTVETVKVMRDMSTGRARGFAFVEMASDDELKTMRPELRMNAYATHGGVARAKFEAYALAASIVGKCHFCVQSHYELLKKEGWTTQQLRDVGRIAAVINATAQVLAVQS